MSKERPALTSRKSYIASILLEVVLVLIAIRGFNWLRIILIELRQAKRWEDSITEFTIAAMIAIITFGIRTIIIASGLGFGAI